MAKNKKKSINQNSFTTALFFRQRESKEGNISATSFSAE